MIPADLTLKVQGEEIPLSFRYKTYVDYSQAKGLDYEDIRELIKTDKAFKGNDRPEIILCAHKTWCAFNGKACTKTELDAMLWMDELREDGQLLEIFYAYVAGYTGISVEEVKKLTTTVVPTSTAEESKKKVKKKP